ncbi:patatin-like phospholipase family protein [Polyangium mundeleinium]|uniref:Patatin-like phospholipase family protein n=1 Tax=Polyangium mundeleinium TaxID=2995306 RepID=A0ABT5F711_9BACT|nr:patatin-like phospholipase family protein [Polyangium mundeleinium]MDC0748871.1 patatin-like phospholipase family protein [Polyangium mundeleinium]
MSDASSSSHEPPKTALCLPGGGLTGALYQIGALAALADGVRGVDGQSFSLYLGQSSGASVAAALAGGIPVDRLYRALLDPVDNFFPLERGHVFRMDIDEWRRALSTSWVAIRHAVARLSSRRDTVSPTAPGHLYLWEQIDRLADSLPAGFFTLDRYERFLAEFFLRRGIPNAFRAMPRPLRIPTYDVDCGDRILFGAEGHEDIPVSLACAASLALPPFFSPIRIGDRHYIDGGLGDVAHLDVAAEAGVEFAVVVNPMVPVSVAHRAVPTGHGVRQSVRDKGLFWVMSQAMRIGTHARLAQNVEQIQQKTGMHVLVLEPEPTDVLLFLHNPSNLAARRAILEYAYRTTRERIVEWMEKRRGVVARLGWKAA